MAELFNPAFFGSPPNLSGRSHSGAVTTTPVNIVFFGDSLIYGTGASSGAGTATGTTLPGVTLSNLGSGYSGTNLGVAGKTLLQMLGDAETQFVPLFDPTKGNAVVVQGGHNDIAQGASATETHARYAKLCGLLRAFGFKVLATATPPAAYPGYPADFNATHAAFLSLVASGWQGYADGFADFRADTRIGVDGSQNNATYFQADKTHLTDAGYAIWAGFLSSAIPGVLVHVSGPASQTDAIGPLAFISSPVGLALVIPAAATNFNPVAVIAQEGKNAKVVFNPSDNANFAQFFDAANNVFCTVQSYPYDGAFLFQRVGSQGKINMAGNYLHIFPASADTSRGGLIATDDYYQNTPYAGFHYYGHGVWETNSGTPISQGGTLGQLRTGFPTADPHVAGMFWDNGTILVRSVG